MLTIEMSHGKDYTGFQEALGIILSSIGQTQIIQLPVDSCLGYASSASVTALVDSPGSDVSLKDGFAIKSADVSNATPSTPAFLEVTGAVHAGSEFGGKLQPGQAIKVFSGAAVPHGAEAVVSNEFCTEAGSRVYVAASAQAGRNIYHAGADVKKSSSLFSEGFVYVPAALSLAAAAGISSLPVYDKPAVHLVAIGDEIAPPGKQLAKGQVYASNLVNIRAWLACFGIVCNTSIIIDKPEDIRKELLVAGMHADIILTCGGAWGSERDLIITVLDGLGWQKLFHRVRIGPGKGTAFGLWGQKRVFCLPGGPPSNEMAFLQLALPGILHMMRRGASPLLKIHARLACDVQGRHPAWTEFKKAAISYDDAGGFLASPLSEKSHMKSMTESTCIICKPEGTIQLKSGQAVTVQLMAPAPAGLSLT